jgi:hypothetical protein
MGPDDVALALKIAAVVAVAVLIVAIVAAASGACAGSSVHDVERALGSATLMTYAQAVAATPEGGKAEERRCAICLSEYAAGGDELVRVVPACGHFFHAGCDVDRWLRARRTCPVCRGGLWPRPECPPMPPRRAGGARVSSTQ